MLDFPSNPNVGDTYDRWEWDGVKWICIPGGGEGGGVIVSPDPPPNPRPGTLWFASDIGQTLTYYDDGNSQQWVVANCCGGDGGGEGMPDYVGEYFDYIDTGFCGPFTNETVALIAGSDYMGVEGDWDVVGSLSIDISVAVGAVTLRIRTLDPWTYHPAPDSPILDGLNFYADFSWTVPTTTTKMTCVTPPVRVEMPRKLIIELVLYTTPTSIYPNARLWLRGRRIR